MEEESIDFILNRHCCRNFFNQPLKEGDLGLLMEALRSAPSAGNCQPWFFYVVLNQAVKMELAKAAYGQDFLTQAAVVFVACANPEESALIYSRRGRELYCLQDTAAAIENLLLASTSLGYGSCWVGAFSEDRVIEVLKIPKNLRPVGIVPVGPGKPPANYPSRKQVQDMFKVIE